MIHSMSGGIIRDAGSYTFVKVLIDGATAPRWFITDLDVEAGNRVRVPDGHASAVGTAVRVERNVSGQVTPVPVRSAKQIIEVVSE